MTRTILALFLAHSAIASCGVTDALETLRPGAKWNLRGNTYAGLEWLDSSDVPTKAEIIQAMSDCQASATTRAAAKTQARLDVKNTALTQGQRLQALLILLDYDK